MSIKFSLSASPHGNDSWLVTQRVCTPILCPSSQWASLLCQGLHCSFWGGSSGVCAKAGGLGLWSYSLLTLQWPHFHRRLVFIFEVPVRLFLPIPQKIPLATPLESPKSRSHYSRPSGKNQVVKLSICHLHSPVQRFPPYEIGEK